MCVCMIERHYVTTESSNVNFSLSFSRVFNAICEHQELRGAVVQQGGAKVNNFFVFSLL